MKRIALACLAAAVLFGCQGDQLTPFQTPSALIQDAGNNNGNQHFFFLPPIVSQPTFSGVFNPNLSPIVEITRLDVNGCAAGVVRTFSGSQVVVSLADERYQVNWHTDADNLNPGCTYRIRVLVGSTELGLADVDVVSSGRELKNVLTDQYIPLLDDRTLPIKFRIEGGALCGAGADCGEGTARPGENTTIVTQNFQAGVFIPAGAVDADVTIIVESVDDRPCIPGLVGQTFQGQPGAADNSCYLFRTDPPLPGGTFNTNVIVGICVDLTGVNESQEPKIQIFQFDDGDSPRLRPLPNAPAPFLPCDPSYQAPIGLAKPGLLNLAARAVGRLLSPRPLFASARPMVFDFGAGGSTDGFSTFTWGLVTDMAKNDGDGQTATVGTAVATPPSVIFHDSTGALVDSVPVTFTVASGGGTVTGASTKSGRGGVSGVARVGSWALGSAGANTLVASGPPFGGVTPPSLTFTATGLAIGSLTFVQQPTDQIANLRTLVVVVGAQDAAGAVLPGVQVTLTDGPLNGALGCGMGETELSALTDATGRTTFSLIDVSGACEGATLLATGSKVGFAPMSAESRSFAIADIGGRGTAAIDGQFDTTWARARCLQFAATIPEGGTTPAMLCAMNDDANVYFLVRFSRGPDPRSSVDFQFDQNRSGGINSGDDLIVFRNPNLTFEDDYWFDNTVSPTCPVGSICSQADAAAGGTTDGQAAYGNNGAESIYEVSHPLSSSDAHDISVAVGQTIDFFLGLNIYDQATGTTLSRTFFRPGLLKLLLK